MPRPDFRQQDMLATGYDLAAGSDTIFAGGVAREHLHGFAVFLLNTASANGVLRLDRRTYDNAGAASVDQGFYGTLTIPSGTVAGRVVYLDQTNVSNRTLPGELKRGEELVIVRTASAGAGVTGHLVLWHEPEYEQPGNNLKLVSGQA